MSLPNQIAAPLRNKSLDWQQARDRLADQIVDFYLQNLPSNYRAVLSGPYYLNQFRAAATELAAIQLELQTLADDNLNTRAEFLYSIVGELLFSPSGFPILSDDVRIRTFLTLMFGAVLSGPTQAAIEQIVNFLADPGTAEIMADPDRIWVWGEGIRDLLGTEQNMRKVLAVLAPAHKLTLYSALFREVIDTLEAEETISLSLQHYDDTRGWCEGAGHLTTSITGFSGRVLHDHTVRFDSIRVGATVRIGDPTEAGGLVRSVVSVGVFGFLDSVNRTAIVRDADGTLIETITVEQGENSLVRLTGAWSLRASYTIEITEGPNAGLYVPIYYPGGEELSLSTTKTGLDTVCLAMQTLVLSQPVTTLNDGETYPITITIDPLGKREVVTIEGEDVGWQFVP